MLLDTAVAATKAVMAQAMYQPWLQAVRWPLGLCSCLLFSHTFEVGGEGLQCWHPLDGHRQSCSHTREICKCYAIYWGWKCAAIQY